MAFVVGGNSNAEAAELYSPGGNCQHKLSSLPITMTEPVLAYIDKTILVYGGDSRNKNFYIYHQSNDSWSVYSTSTFTHDLQPGEIYNEKIYISDDSNPEVFYPGSDTWSTWPTPKNTAGTGACLVAWKDTFFLIGGSSNQHGVQSFNHSSDTWQVLDSTNVPMDIYYSSCILLPSDNILVVGSENSLYQSSAALYNIGLKTWTKLPDTSVNRHGTSLVMLGSRVFAMDSDERNVIEEFHYNNNTWSSVEAKLIVPRMHHGTIALPAELFQHLPGGCVGVQ